MTDRIEEIKASHDAGFDYKEDVPFLLGEIDRLKMMLDAEVAGKETMQRKMVERNENLRLDYLDAIAERDAAVFDLTIATNCDTCGNNNTSDCHIEAETGGCNYEWRGAQK